MLVIAVGGWIVLQKTPIGRDTYFAGQAPTAAALAGIRVPHLRVGALVSSSLLAAFAGVMRLAPDSELLGQLLGATAIVETDGDANVAIMKPRN